MFCTKCGQELDLNNRCQNPSCISMQINKRTAKTRQRSFDDNGYYDNSYSGRLSYVSDDMISPDEVSDFVGYKKSEYYLEKWDKYQFNGHFASWNWGTFFFSWAWFAYRKMYEWAILFYLLPIMLSLLFTILPLKTALIVVGISIFMSYIIMILFANQIYMRHVEKRISSVKYTMQNFDDDEIAETLTKKGGVSLIAIIVFSILNLLLLSAILFYLFIKIDTLTFYDFIY